MTEDGGSFSMNTLCASSVGAQARKVASDNMNTAENVQIEFGNFACNEAEQSDGACDQYEARFCCEKSEKNARDLLVIIRL